MLRYCLFDAKIQHFCYIQLFFKTFWCSFTKSWAMKHKFSVMKHPFSFSKVRSLFTLNIVRNSFSRFCPILVCFRPIFYQGKIRTFVPKIFINPIY